MGRVSAAQKFAERLEFGDLLLLVYFIVVARQWFWTIDNRLAWILTVPAGLAGWLWFIANKDPLDSRPQISFWLIVGFPLLIAYAIRVPIPDSSFDVWGLRLFHGDRGLHGFIYLPGEFFPTAAPFNPTPDMITALFRYALGYRLGTIVNLLALLWTATIVERLLRSSVTNATRRALAVLLVVFVEQLLFEVNNYMPDLLALPLLLEATRITLESRAVERRTVIRVAFLISLAVTLKLSNGAVALPIVLLWAWRCVKQMDVKTLAATTLASLAVFIVPLLPFTIWVYKLTGSPIFPLYNGIFRSPLYPLLNGWDNRWGGYGFYELVAWPVLIFFKPERASELPVYSGRLSAGFLAALVCFCLWRRVNLRLRQLAFILVFAALLWSITMGYIRYGLYLEVIAGLLLIELIALLVKTRQNWKLATAALLCTLVLSQSVLAGYYLTQREWSMRPTAFDDWKSFTREARVLGQDRSIRALMSDDERVSFDRVEVWIVSGAKTAGIMPLLNERAKFIGVRWGGLFLAPATRAELQRALDQVAGKQMWSLAFPSDYDEAVKAINAAGLSVTDRREVMIPFYSNTYYVKAYFFRVLRKGEDQTDSGR